MIYGYDATAEVGKDLNNTLCIRSDSLRSMLLTVTKPGVLLYLAV